MYDPRLSAYMIQKMSPHREKQVENVVPRPSPMEEGEPQGAFRWPTTDGRKKEKAATVEDEPPVRQSPVFVGDQAFWSEQMREYLSKAKKGGDETNHARAVNVIKAKEQPRRPRASNYYIMDAEQRSDTRDTLVKPGAQDLWSDRRPTVFNV